MSKTLKIFSIHLVLMLLLTGNVVAQDISVAASVQSDYGVVNQAVRLNVTIDGQSARSASAPALPDFGEWFSYAGSNGTSQNIQIVNGAMNVSLTYTYTLIPLKVGQAVIPPITIMLGQKKYSTAEIKIEIKDASTAAAPPANNRGRYNDQSSQPIDLVLYASPEKTEVYKGEGLTVEYKIYIGAGISVTEYTPTGQPNSAGFWVEDYPAETSPIPRAERFNGKNYQAAVLKKMEMFPTNTGELQIDPLEMDFRARSNQRSRNSVRSFFDDPFFNRSNNVKIKSNAVKINVKPLPEAGKPRSFDGLVGDFEISASVNSGNVKANESVTLKVNLTGVGNIKLLPEPKLKIVGEHEIYDPQVTENIVRSGSSIKGTKSFEYVIIPRREGPLKIEPIVISYFDPEKEVYKTIKTRSISVNVEKGDRVIVGGTKNLTRNEIRVLGQDIRFIKQSVNEWLVKDKGVYTFGGFYLFLFMPIIVVSSLFLYSQHLDKMNENVGYKRSKLANTTASKRLKQAEQLLVNEDKGFYQELSKALQGYIADKLNISSAGIVKEDLEKMLKKSGLQDDLITKYISCLNLCDFNQFASISTGTESMKALYDDSKKIIINIEEGFKKKA